MAYLFGARRWWRQRPAAVRSGWRGGVEAAGTRCLHRRRRGKVCGAFTAVVVDEALATLRRQPGSGAGKGATGETAMGRSPQPPQLGHEPGSSQWGSCRVCRSRWGYDDQERRSGGGIGTHDDGDWFWLPSVISFLPFVRDSPSFNLPDIWTHETHDEGFPGILCYCLFSFAPFHLYVYMLFLSFTFASGILSYSLFLFAPFHLLLLR
jgi:hypothetical protein